MAPIPQYSRSELDAIAHLFLEKHGQYDGRALRLVQVIEKSGYVIFEVEGLAEIAEAYVPAKENYIFVDAAQCGSESPRWRFTLAEELAHILLHRGAFEGKSAEEIVQMQEAVTDEEYRRIESDAKYLAGCLLLPEASFVERFNQFWDKQEEKSSNDLQTLRYVIRQLNFDFNVSRYSIGLRALFLGLIDQEQFDEFTASYETK